MVRCISCPLDAPAAEVLHWECAVEQGRHFYVHDSDARFREAIRVYCLECKNQGEINPQVNPRPLTLDMLPALAAHRTAIDLTIDDTHNSVASTDPPASGRRHHRDVWVEPHLDVTLCSCLSR